MNLSQYIKELLFKTNYVVIPNFGAFIINYSDSHINSANNFFSPPSAGISFNINLNKNDGALANFISRKLNITYHEALRIVKEYSDELNMRLYSNKSIVFDSIGEIKLNKNNNIEFQSYQSELLFPYSYGLSGFIAYPANRNVLTKKIEKNLINKTNQFKSKRIYNTTKWAAAAAILVFISLLIINRFNRYDSDFVYTDLFSHISSKIYNSHITNTDIKKSPLIIDKAVEPNISSSEQPVSKQRAENKNESGQEPISESEYFIICGCFSMEENANALVKELTDKGYNAFICGKTKNNLFRVTYGLYKNMNSALTELQQIKNSDNPSAWILRKN
ncbi:MAG: SPOR domain-containing protein [Bacteroidales bacterium]|nr:SPOR domain-containing protein [Bacteroidales bacterium]